MIEYSQIGYGVQVGDETVLSYVTVGDHTHIPSGLVLQTVPLKHNKYVTFAFGQRFWQAFSDIHTLHPCIHPSTLSILLYSFSLRITVHAGSYDDFKAKHSSTQSKLKVFGVPMATALAALNATPQHIWPGQVHPLFHHDSDSRVVYLYDAVSF